MSRSRKKKPFADRGRNRKELKQGANKTLRHRYSGPQALRDYEADRDRDVILDGGKYKRRVAYYEDLNELGHFPAPSWETFWEECQREDPDMTEKEARKLYIKTYKMK